MKSKFYVSVTLILIAIFFITGCDWASKVAIVKNRSNKPIYIVYSLHSFVSDSSVIGSYKYLKEYIVNPDTFKTILTFDRVLNREPDSSKIYLHIFNVDSLIKYEKASHFKGIFAHSLIKSVKIQLNKVKEPADTIYVDKK
ncbi:hypothetical protein JN11_04346 [Mucilaginibacter frigoritolerans]|uniref:Lipoprotein n=1 Tax=Mucilaginibacter frigoritolerans TaxID=652788 RepID=A0A562TPW7_9SPHI|nr:hypothetical protein [Mucilaginibacter frigoritolerans]TWI95607.1 hypothetical protein JN11_04346 [Mucilaginibacter frigoritolerans]